MRIFFILLALIVIGKHAIADTLGEVDLVPVDILYSIEKMQADDSVISNGPIGECIILYRNLRDLQDVSVEAFHSPFKDAMGNVEEAIGAAKEKFLLPGNPKYELEYLQGIEQGIALLKDWALDDVVSGRAKVLRLIYATAKLEEISAFVKKQNQRSMFYLRPRELWEKLRVKFPYDVYRKYPNESIDGLLVSIFDHDGKFKKNDKLSLILGSPFVCPSTEFHQDNPALKPSIYDYASIQDTFNSGDLDTWFEKQMDSEPVADQAAAPLEIHIPLYDYQNRIEELTGSNDPNDILLLALLMHTFGTADDVAQIAEMLDGIRDQLESSCMANDFEPDGPYDGTDESMIDYLRHYSENHLGGAAYFTIPCGVLIENPELMPSIYAYYGGNRDNFLPRHDCRQSDYPLPQSVETYLKLVDMPQCGWLSGHQGTMRYMHYKVLDGQNLMMRAFPRQLIGEENQKRHQYPYETWSYLNAENRKVYKIIKTAYDVARKDLIKHYIENFALTNDEATEAAESALWLTVREVHWGEPPTSGLRYKIVEDYPYKEILQDVDAVDDLANATHSMMSMEYYSGAWSYVGLPDPLIMMVVKRPDVLRLLIKKKNSQNDQAYDYNRWSSLAYNNPNTGINAKNKIGKSALHIAIQQNDLESTKILVESGADLNAIVDGDLIHNKRTIAMYAAAHGDIDLIGYLIEKGVDFHAADSRGVKPVGYLLGFGILDKNQNLTSENYKDYIDLVDPDFFTANGGDIMPGFDCEKSSNYVEQAICSHTELAIYDRMLSAEYNNFYSTAADRESLKRSQIEWLTHRNECNDVDCIEQAYQQRLKELR